MSKKEESIELIAARGISALVESHDELTNEIMINNDLQKEAEERYQEAVQKALEQWRKEASLLGKKTMAAMEKQVAIMDAIKKMGVCQHI